MQPEQDDLMGFTRSIRTSWASGSVRYDCPDPDCAWFTLRTWPEYQPDTLERILELHMMEHMRGEV